MTHNDPPESLENAKKKLIVRFVVANFFFAVFLIFRIYIFLYHTTSTDPLHTYLPIAFLVISIFTLPSPPRHKPAGATDSNYAGQLYQQAKNLGRIGTYTRVVYLVILLLFYLFTYKTT